MQRLLIMFLRGLCRRPSASRLHFPSLAYASTTFAKTLIDSVFKFYYVKVFLIQFRRVQSALLGYYLSLSLACVSIYDKLDNKTCFTMYALIACIEFCLISCALK